MTGDGTVIATIAAGVAHDAAGNGNNASSSTDNNVTYDTTPPVVTATTPDDGSTHVPTTATVSATFSEAVQPGTVSFTLQDSSGSAVAGSVAYNSATQEVCRYSACGPTRPTGGHGHRQKPEVCAPAEEDAAGRGILSASSRRAQPTRMNGTSASAPQVAGLVALMFQYRRYKSGAALTADAHLSSAATGIVEVQFVGAG